MKRVLWLCVFSLVTLGNISNVYAASSHKSKSSAKKSKKSRIHTKSHSDDYMEGVASCYARKFVGRRTTSGDVFSMDKYTGAHPTLPMRTKLKVTNVDNGKVVYIEVNDRMGKASGHVIDLTLTAARKINVCPGLGHVELEVLDNDSYHSLLKGQVGQMLIGANPLLSESDRLELANQYADMMAHESNITDRESANK